MTKRTKELGPMVDTTSEAPEQEEQGRRAELEPAAVKAPPTERETIKTAMRRTGLILDRLTETQRKRVVAALVALYGAEA